MCVMCSLSLYYYSVTVGDGTWRPILTGLENISLISFLCMVLGKAGKEEEGRPSLHHIMQWLEKASLSKHGWTGMGMGPSRQWGEEAGGRKRLALKGRQADD